MRTILRSFDVIVNGWTAIDRYSCRGCNSHSFFFRRFPDEQGNEMKKEERGVSELVKDLAQTSSILLQKFKSIGLNLPVFVTTSNKNGDDECKTKEYTDRDEP